MPRKKIKSDDTLPLRLSERERDLILNEVFPAPELMDRFRLAIVDGHAVVARLTLDDLDELGGAVAAVANHAMSKTLQKEMDRLFDRIQNLLDTYTDEDE